MKDQNYALAYEFGGRVCQDDKDKCFFCTGPVTDPSDSVVKTMKAPCPAGSKDVGMYHTHPWYSPLMNGTDVAGIGPGKASYLWVVSKKGPVLKYEPPDPYQRTIDFIPVPTAHE